MAIISTIPNCPYCGGPGMNVGFDFITCGAAWNEDCEGHAIKDPVGADGETSTRWNDRARVMAAFDQTIADLKKWVGAT